MTRVVPRALYAIDEATAPACTARVGADVQEVAEVAEALARYPQRYLRRLFSADEIQHVHAHPATAAVFLAGRVAAREAVVKLLRLDGRRATWHDVVVHGSREPRVELRGEARRVATAHGVTEVLLSIHYGRRLATAVCVGASTTTTKGFT